MTRVVLYTQDLEPITVIELKPWTEGYLNRHGQVNIAVTPIFKLMDYDPGPPPIHAEFHQVCIQAEMLHRKGRRHMLLITRDEESALLLKSAFLPGQYRELQERERRARADGFIMALNALRDM